MRGSCPRGLGRSQSPKRPPAWRATLADWPWLCDRRRTASQPKTHLVHCVNEAPQPDGTWIGGWLKLAHLDFSAQEAKSNPRSKPRFRAYHRPASSRCRQRGLNAPVYESRKAAGEPGFLEPQGGGRSRLTHTARALLVRAVRKSRLPTAWAAFASLTAFEPMGDSQRYCREARLVRIARKAVG
jgi:hypothetical protein